MQIGGGSMICTQEEREATLICARTLGWFKGVSG